VLRKVFGRKMEEVPGGWMKLRSVEVQIGGACETSEK
jgi:hypothetical protein